ncbi:MAG: NRDE family protein [Myxococcales bacterium]|nr:NRDE family protein [Myxococcales bacterium]
MCTLVILHRVVPGLPVVLAANRDEYLARPATGPMLLDAERGIIGGRDLSAGGTWLGFTPGGFFAGVTNQRQGARRDAPGSRGQVVLDVLRAGAEGGVDAARRWLGALDVGRYNPFNLAFGDAEGVWVAYGRHDLRVEAVPAGVHVLPNDVLDSAVFPKVARIQGRLAAPPGAWPALVARLEAVLADDTPPAQVPDEPDAGLPRAALAALHAVKVVLPGYGTRSATIAALAPGRVAHYLHADGAPGDAPFVDRAALVAAARGDDAV